MSDRYHLTVTVGNENDCKLCLSALITQTTPMQVIHAKIDTADGELTTDGHNAFRCLCLAETMIRHALGIPLESDEVLHLKAQVQRLQQQVAELASAQPESV